MMFNHHCQARSNAPQGHYFMSIAACYLLMFFTGLASLCYYRTMSQSKKTLLFTGFLGGLLYVIYAYWLSPVPLNWTTYTNLKVRKYSFAHPKDWIVSECGNGEVVVSSKPIEKCIEPLAATEEYLQDVYFQVFLPKNNMVIRRQDFNKINAPSYLKDWETVVWEEQDIQVLSKYRRAWTDAIPYKQLETISSDVDWRAITYPMSWFSIGFISKTSEQKTIEKVLRSIKLYPPTR